jgi:hypothetical protein
LAGNGVALLSDNSVVTIDTPHRSVVMRQAMSLLAGSVCAVSLGMAHPAFADAIDGDWCRADGKRMTIRGPAIVTPGGQRTSGDYDRHSFSYVVPAGEAGAGATVSIRLLHEYLAHAREGADAAVQEWRRCQPGVSERPVVHRPAT